MSQEERRQMDKTERLSELQAAFKKIQKQGLSRIPLNSSLRASLLKH